MGGFLLLGVVVRCSRLRWRRLRCRLRPVSLVLGRPLDLLLITTTLDAIGPADQAYRPGFIAFHLSFSVGGSSGVVAEA